MSSVKGFFGRRSVLVILFQQYGPKLGFVEVIYSGWISMNPRSFILEKELILY